MSRGGPPGPQGPQGPRRERRWQTSQERARVAAELIEEAESLTQTGAIASPNDVARDQQPPPLRIARPPATPGPMEITARLDEGEPPGPPHAPPPPPAPPSSTAAPEPAAPAPAPPPAPAPVADEPLYVEAREASERGEIERAAATYRELLARDPK